MTELSTRDLAVRVLRQQRTAMMAMLGEALDAYKSPVDSSPRSADDDWINNQPRVRREALNGILGFATEQVAPTSMLSHSRCSSRPTRCCRSR